MNKLSMLLAILSLVVTNSAFANFVIGRVDVVVDCSTSLVNGYSLQVTNTEGTPGYFATISHGGVIGSTRLAGPLEVKMSTTNKLTTIVDAATAGHVFKLVINQNKQMNEVAQNPSDYSFKSNSRASFRSPLPSEPNLRMLCQFPVHIM